MSVHCCVCADDSAAAVNEGFSTSRRRKNQGTFNSKNSTFHAVIICKMRVPVAPVVQLVTSKTSDVGT